MSPTRSTPCVPRCAASSIRRTSSCGSELTSRSRWMRPVPEPAPQCTSGRGALMPPASLVGRCALLRRLHELLVAPADLLGVPVHDELALVHPQHASAHALNGGQGMADQEHGSG